MPQLGDPVLLVGTLFCKDWFDSTDATSGGVFWFWLLPFSAVLFYAAWQMVAALIPTPYRGVNAQTVCGLLKRYVDIPKRPGVFTI